VGKKKNFRSVETGVGCTIYCKKGRGLAIIRNFGMTEGKGLVGPGGGNGSSPCARGGERNVPNGGRATDFAEANDEENLNQKGKAIGKGRGIRRFPLLNGKGEAFVGEAKIRFDTRDAAARFLSTARRTGEEISLSKRRKRKGNDARIGAMSQRCRRANEGKEILPTKAKMT